MQQTQYFPSVPLDRVERERVARLERAGVRHIPAESAPTSTFVAVETAVLVMVAALAMTSIIVTAGDPDRGSESAARSSQATHQVAATSANDGARRDALFVAR